MPIQLKSFVYETYFHSKDEKSKFDVFYHVEYFDNPDSNVPFEIVDVEIVDEKNGEKVFDLFTPEQQEKIIAECVAREIE